MNHVLIIALLATAIVNSTNKKIFQRNAFVNTTSANPVGTVNNIDR